MLSDMAVLWLALLQLFVLPVLQGAPVIEGTIAFGTVGRPQYAFDIFFLPSPSFTSEVRLTDGVSVNYNGQFLGFEEQQSIFAKQLIGPQSGGTKRDGVVFVSERNGKPQIYFSLFSTDSRNGKIESSHLLGPLRIVGEEQFQPSLYDRPTVKNGRIIYVSTHEPASKPRQSWAAVYSTDLATGTTLRLTPSDVADFSPAVSPSGKWIAVASNQGKGWNGEVQELDTDLYIFDAEDGSARSMLVRNAGWPSWADDSTIFFHRRDDDGWWGIYRATFLGGFYEEKSLKIVRITPPGIHVFTPAASADGKWLAVATRRPGEYRHIEVYDLTSKSFIEVTKKISPHSHHYNPFVSASSDRIGYHRCRTKIDDAFSGDWRERKLQSVGKDMVPLLEQLVSPLPRLSVVRSSGYFPAFSPDGSLFAYIPDLGSAGGVVVTRLNGEGKRKVFDGSAFGLAWDKKRKGVLYTSYGIGFSSVDKTVHVISILNADASDNEEELKVRILTKKSNNAFPFPSPDGKWVVFRSGRSGYKNLYIMDAVHGEEVSLRQLTKGPWTDTMPNWSPDGQWIAFSSDRDNPGNGSFSLYFIHPDGSGLHKVLSSSEGGRINHPYFSPDSQSLVFTTDYAAVSAEPISVSQQFQPYGEIFISRIDGNDLQRLIHNAYEDGTPSWAPPLEDLSLLAFGTGDPSICNFKDVYWLVYPNGVQSTNQGCSYAAISG